jgi:hypothetical protein
MCQCGLLKYHDPKTKKNKNKNTRKDWSLFLSSLIKRTRQNQNNYFPAAASSSVLEEGAASHPQPAAALPSAPSAGRSPVDDEDSAVRPASSVEHVIDDPGGGADDNVPGDGSINSVEHELNDPGGGTADDDPGGGGSHPLFFPVVRSATPGNCGVHLFSTSRAFWLLRIGQPKKKQPS